MTSIPYNLGIPNAPNNPSTDQPNMLTNNNNIATFVAVDHVGFNVSASGLTSGQHAQVTFNGNNVPTLPTPVYAGKSEGILFTDNVGTVNQLFYYAGTAAQSEDQYVSASTGSTFLLGGIILKWGQVINAANNTTVNFTPAFPNNCWSVTVSGGLTSGTQPTINVNPSSVTTGLFVLKITGTTPVNVFYIAIGN